MLWLLAATAFAHITLLEPEPVTSSQKDGPCGNGPHVRGDEIAVYSPGETITLRWRETINHPSTYRIAFDADGDDDFVDPATPDDFYNTDPVLLDNIPDEDDHEFAVQVTLPDVTCEGCTLQLIQLMLDKPPYVPGTNDLYYQCADIALREGPADSGETEVARCQTGASGGGFGALALVGALLVGRRRRA